MVPQWLDFERSHVDEDFLVIHCIQSDSASPKWEEHSIWTVPHNETQVQPLLLRYCPASMENCCQLTQLAGLWIRSKKCMVGIYTSSRKAHEGIDTTWKWKAFYESCKMAEHFLWLICVRRWESKGFIPSKVSGIRACPPKRKVHDCNIIK